MGRDKASELPLLQCEAARGAAAKLPAATTDKTANTSVNRFIGNDPTFFFRFADAPVSAPATAAPWTFVRVRSFTEKAQIAYSHGHPPLSAWVVARRREVQSEKESPRASPSRMSSLADKDGQSGPPADDAHMADRCEGVAGFTVFPCGELSISSTKAMPQNSGFIRTDEANTCHPCERWGSGRGDMTSGGTAEPSSGAKRATGLLAFASMTHASKRARCSIGPSPVIRTPARRERSWRILARGERRGRWIPQALRMLPHHGAGGEIVGAQG